MRILLAHNSTYYPAHGGGDRSNRLLMEALAACGHTVRVVSRIEKFGEVGHAKLLADLAARGVEAVAEDAVHFMLHGVDVRTLTGTSNLRTYFAAQVEAFDPDVILTSTDDPGQLLFDVAVRAPRARVVHLVRATIAVPFGPDSSIANRAKAEMLRSADAVVGVSEYVAEYCRKWGGMPAVHVPISLMEPGNAADVGSFDSPYIMMVNPCAVKGIDIFVALAARLPELHFAAVPTWGTNAEDFALLRSQPNINVFEPVDDVEELLRQSRVVLVPSVWAEARSRFVVEAMLRGVPVIASDAGGIREAKLGVPYLVPVNVIRNYKPALDENMVPVAERPAQDIAPWEEALRRLTGDREHWAEVAAASRAAALDYVASVSAEPFERLLLDVVARPKAVYIPDARHRLASVLLKQRAGARSKWFPTLQPAGRSKLRLFCFPHAGGGTLLYRNWKSEGVEVCPVLLPGRESRVSEAPIDNMPEMVGVLAEAIRPFTSEPYAFFGHSMGAGIAFELARVLDQRPCELIVSSARAPQYRLGLAARPDPTDDELLTQLAGLGGDRASLSLALSWLRADIRLYRNYAFTPGIKLACGIAAYGGTEDPQVRAEDLAGWQDLTAGHFVQRAFPGGHFYLQSQPGPVCTAIAADLDMRR